MWFCRKNNFTLNLQLPFHSMLSTHPGGSSALQTRTRPSGYELIVKSGRIPA
jgi:hypothetical protein